LGPGACLLGSGARGVVQQVVAFTLPRPLESFFGISNRIPDDRLVSRCGTRAADRVGGL
jgi:hypothetical protein